MWPDLAFPRKSFICAINFDQLCNRYRSITAGLVYKGMICKGQKPLPKRGALFQFGYRKIVYFDRYIIYGLAVSITTLPYAPKLISPAHAVFDDDDYRMLKRGFASISSSIRGISACRN